MTLHYISDAGAASRFAAHVTPGGPLALDCEAAGFHRYSDRLCLVQLSAPGNTWILDALALDLEGVVRVPLEDPGREVFMHGSAYDLRLLDRDLGVRVRGLFDTQVAAALLGETALGLSALLKRHLGVRLTKKYQRADWAMRPLPRPMLEYAASDTRHLHDLVGLLRRRLREQGRLDWAEEEFRRLERTEWKPPDSGRDPIAGMKKARDFGPHALERLRVLRSWRDEIARKLDRALFRVASDQILLRLAEFPPHTLGELRQEPGLSRGLVRSGGGGLLRRLRKVDALAENDIAPFPGPARRAVRLTPVEVGQAEELRRARSRRARELGLDPGLLLPNRTIFEVVRARPRSARALARLPDVRNWQIRALGPLLPDILWK